MGEEDEFAAEGGWLVMAWCASLAGGAPRHGQRLLDQIEATTATRPALGAHLQRLEGLINVMLSRPGAVGLLHDAAVELCTQGTRAARDTYLEAIEAVAVVPSIGTGRSARHVAIAALSAPAAPGPRNTGDLLLTGYATSSPRAVHRLLLICATPSARSRPFSQELRIKCRNGE
jgi:hypothetical protein